MGFKTKLKLLLIIILPFVMGFAIERLIGFGIMRDQTRYLSTANTIMQVWTYAGVLFLFYAGRVFASVNVHPGKSFILGKTIWMISLLLYTWQFVIVNSAGRNFLVAGMSQHYVLGFVRWGSWMVSIFTNHIHGTLVIYVSFLFMLMIYSLGFASVFYPRYK